MQVCVCVWGLSKPRPRPSFITQKEYLIIIVISPKYYDTVTASPFGLENDERTLNTVYIHKQVDLPQHATHTPTSRYRNTPHTPTSRYLNMPHTHLQAGTATRHTHLQAGTATRHTHTYKQVPQHATHTHLEAGSSTCHTHT